MFLFPVPLINSGVAAAAYVGPGDVVASAVGWWGLRAYTTASIGANAVRLRESGLNTEQDFATIAGGGLNLAAIATFKGANNLFVTKLYDQVSTSHFAQATAAKQPKFILSAIGSLPAMQDNGAGTTYLAAAGSATIIPQPHTFSAVYEVLTNADAMIVVGHAGAYPQIRSGYTGANKITLNTGPSDPGIVATASDGAWHALQGVFNGASSDANVDGSSNAGTITNDNQTNLVLDLFSYSGSSNFFRGYIGEVGLWASAFSGGNRTAMSSNQHTYWGF